MADDGCRVGSRGLWASLRVTSGHATGPDRGTGGWALPRWAGGPVRTSTEAAVGARIWHQLTAGPASCLHHQQQPSLGLPASGFFWPVCTSLS